MNQEREVTVCVCVDVVSTVEEFTKTHLTPRWDLSYDRRLKPATIPTDTPPTSFDWRQHNVVTHVKNQVNMDVNVEIFWSCLAVVLMSTVYLCRDCCVASNCEIVSV